MTVNGKSAGTSCHSSNPTASSSSLAFPAKATPTFIDALYAEDSGIRYITAGTRALHHMADAMPS